MVLYRAVPDILVRAPAFAETTGDDLRRMPRYWDTAVLQSQPRMIDALHALRQGSGLSTADRLRLRAFAKRSTERATPFGMLGLVAAGVFSNDETTDLHFSTLIHRRVPSQAEERRRDRRVAAASTELLTITPALLLLDRADQIALHRPLLDVAEHPITLQRLTAVVEGSGCNKDHTEALIDQLRAQRVIVPVPATGSTAPEPTDSDERFLVATGGAARFPRQIRSQTETVAHTLALLAPDVSLGPDLRDFHAQFLERFDLDRLLPLSNLLHPAWGLDAPDGYGHPRSGNRPAGERWASSAGEQSQRDDARLMKLTVPLERAIWRGDREFDISDEIVQALQDEDSFHSVPPPVDLMFDLLRWPNAEAQPTLSLADHPGVPGFGAARARFDPVTGGDNRMRMRDYATRLQDAGFEAVTVEYVPINIDLADIAMCRPQFDRSIDFGVGVSRERRIDPEAVLVGANRDGFIILDEETGRRLLPLASSAVFPRNAPNPARLLLDIGLSHFRRWDPWACLVPFARSPHLPRITRSGCVLRRETWLAPPSPGSHTDASLNEWRQNVGLPRHVVAGEWDRILHIDLESADDRQLLLREWKRSGEQRVHESLERARLVSTPRGMHYAQVSVSMTPTRVPSQAKTSPDVRNRRDAPSGIHFPGGEILSLKLYGPFAGQRILLSREDVRDALRRVPSFFFLHYRDPRPHLRLRILSPDAGNPFDFMQLLQPALERAVHDGLIGTWLIDSYEPEIERYGGADALQSVHGVFAADSAAVVDLLATRPSAEAVELDAVLAMHCAIRAYGADGDLLMAALPKEAQRMDQRLHLLTAEALSILRTTSRESTDPMASHRRLANALDLHASVAATTRPPVSNGVTSPPGVPSSVVHMMANRRFGIDPLLETRSLLVALRCQRALDSSPGQQPENG